MRFIIAGLAFVLVGAQALGDEKSEAAAWQKELDQYLGIAGARLEQLEKRLAVSTSKGDLECLKDLSEQLVETRAEFEVARTAGCGADTCELANRFGRLIAKKEETKVRLLRHFGILTDVDQILVLGCIRKSITQAKELLKEAVNDTDAAKTTEDRELAEVKGKLRQLVDNVRFLEDLENVAKSKRPRL